MRIFDPNPGHWLPITKLVFILMCMPSANGSATKCDLGVCTKSGSAMDDSEENGGKDLYKVRVGKSHIVGALDPNDEIKPDGDDYTTTQLDNLETYMGQLSILAVVDENEDE